MFLTRLRLNPARRGARKLLGSPHAMHAAVRAAFPEDAAYEQPDARTLWRLDSPAPQTVTLYVTSPGRPDLTHVVEEAGWPTTHPFEVRDYGPLLGSLSGGQRWAFRLTANPVHNGRRGEDSKETQRFGYLREAEQAEWLADRAARHGFSLATQTDGSPNLRLHHRQMTTFKRGGGAVTLVMATYDGILEIVDVAAFGKALTLGIGHAKAYGCGLLTLAPAG